MNNENRDRYMIDIFECEEVGGAFYIQERIHVWPIDK